MYADLKNFELVEGDTDIAAGVKTLLTPGHTPGSQSVAVTTDKGTAIISGLCCVSDNLYPPEELGAPVICPGIHTNAAQAFDSLLKVKQMADIAVPLHDVKFSCKGTIPW
jgi:glyoxylase-like metal-dependent hydrolase (beta-lactamase superfamily II)